MVTEFVTIEVPLHSNPEKLQRAILTELGRVGEPLRWAIVSVEGDRVSVEAVVTTVGAA